MDDRKLTDLKPKKRHRWKWSGKNDGRGTCKDCGIKVRPVRSPRGGTIMSWYRGPAGNPTFELKTRDTPECKPEKTSL